MMSNWCFAWTIGRRIVQSPVSIHRSGRISGFRLFSSSRSIDDGTTRTGGNTAASKILTKTPTLWEGASHASSEFVTHVIAGPDEPTVSQAIGSALITEMPLVETTIHPDRDNACLTPSHLLILGSVWFLAKSAPRDPSLGTKPTRLTAQDATRVLEEGDYLRVHHSPRRFPKVYDYDWGKSYTLTETEQPTDIEQSKPGVIIGHDVEKGYVVVNKPAGIPVHCTVDNILENVSEFLRIESRKNMTEEEVYVTTPQRLDQNTSGLLVVATKKVFAAYCAKLLRQKTGQQLSTSGNSRSAIHKQYKCLVCLVPTKGDNTTWSVTDAVDSLNNYATDQTVMRHYLEPSVRAPKNFARVAGNDTWAESLLRIKRVGDVCPLVGSQAGQELASALWIDPETMPDRCIAVVELEIELMTGRTHQIRGQLSTEGFPLVGDAQYGGAKPSISPDSGYVNSDQLALECCQLEFLDPDISTSKKRGEVIEIGVASDRWNTFRLEEAWWTPLINKYGEQALVCGSAEATTGASDNEQIRALKEMKSLRNDGKNGESSAETLGAELPPKAMIAPGVHKYVLVKARHPGDVEAQWFVKSAPPSECGGPYHANVAQGLVEALHRAGYDTTITGGGRIDYNKNASHVRVYGFSYGFGKGDHSRAASIIEDWSNNTITATFDNSNALY